MRFAVSGLTLAAMLLASCGGGDSGGGSVIIPIPTPTPTPTGGCNLRERQDWALAQMREWYLFPETLPSAPNPSAYTTLDDYVDSLTATARSQGRDRYFTYVTSIAEEAAYNTSGATVGFGMRLALAPGNRLVITESYEEGPAIRAGIDRGDEILAIGTSAVDMKTVASLMASGDTTQLAQALGPDTEGTARLLRVATATGTRDVTVTKAKFEILPLSSRYGSRILDVNGKRIGYINMRTFIATADNQLRKAFADFRAQGVTEFVIDLRYNGGGLVSTANVMADLLGGNRSSNDLFTRMQFRPEKSGDNESYYFRPTASSVSPVKIAFIGTRSTASASEAVINGLLPYMGNNIALIGTNTYGKPVGQIARDRRECDDRFRIIAFSLSNANGNANYYNGLASSVPVTCYAPDDIRYGLGDVQETALATAIGFLNGNSCSPISTAAATAATRGMRLGGAAEMELLSPQRPSAAQRDMPGMF